MFAARGGGVAGIGRDRLAAVGAGETAVAGAPVKVLERQLCVVNMLAIVSGGVQSAETLPAADSVAFRQFQSATGYSAVVF